MTDQTKPAKKRATVRKCPVCGREAWPIMYGEVMPDARAEFPKTDFAGCCIDSQPRIYPVTGKVEIGTPKWACQNADCQHRWW